jgi:aflatoxin B1 aldehyde reductase
MCHKTAYSACSEGGPLPDDALKLLDDAWAKAMSLAPLYGKKRRLLVVLFIAELYFIPDQR